MPDVRKTGSDARKKTGPGPGDLMGIGITFTASILVFLYLGRWVDGKLGTEPLFLIVGVFTGFGLSILWMYRRLVVRDKEEK